MRNLALLYRAFAHITNHLERRMNKMSEKTEAMALAIKTLQDKIGAGVSPEQIQAQIHLELDPVIAGLNDKIAAIIADDTDDDAKVADIEAELKIFTDGFAPPPGLPAADSAPDSAA